jgi:SREBP regulating gene protein
MKKYALFACILFLLGLLSTLWYHGRQREYKDALNRKRRVQRRLESFAGAAQQSANSANANVNLHSHDASVSKCRHTEQGRQVVVDDRGNVCSKWDVHVHTGCCLLANTSALVWQQTCHACTDVFSLVADDHYHDDRHGGDVPDLSKIRDANEKYLQSIERKKKKAHGGVVVVNNDSDDDDRPMCCAQYEVCVSCCMRAEYRPLLRRLLERLLAVEHRLYVDVRDAYDLCTKNCRTSSYSVLFENAFHHPERPYCFGIY